MATTITREYWISAAHRLEDHPKCGRLHGHNYKIVVEVGGVMSNGWIIDFGELDRVLKPILDWYDHKYLVSRDNIAKGDLYYNAALLNGHGVQLNSDYSTAEELARVFFDQFSYEIKRYSINAYVVWVTVWETEKSSATYEPGD